MPNLKSDFAASNAASGLSSSPDSNARIASDTALLSDFDKTDSTEDVNFSFIAG